MLHTHLKYTKLHNATWVPTSKNYAVYIYKCVLIINNKSQSYEHFNIQEHFYLVKNEIVDWDFFKEIVLNCRSATTASKSDAHIIFSVPS